MAKTTSDSILGVIWKESWILDHFEIFVNIALNGTTVLCWINMLGGGLHYQSAFLVIIIINAIYMAQVWKKCSKCTKTVPHNRTTNSEAAITVVRRRAWNR